MRTLIDMSEGQVVALDALARPNNRSRAALVREAIDQFLAKQRVEDVGDAFDLLGIARCRWPCVSGKGSWRMVAALFDTNILIDHNAVPQARDEIARYPDRAISVTTWMEVMIGAGVEVAEATRRYLDGLCSSLSTIALPIVPSLYDESIASGFLMR